MAELSSSGDSVDEEEVFRNFDQEAQNIIETETLPKKSSDRYLLVYNAFKKWREEHKNSLSKSHESNLIIYFTQLKEKLKPPTLWSIWSMLRTTLNTHENIDIKNFLNLRALVKNNAKGYKPKKAPVFKWEQIMRFLTEAPDNMYLAAKVKFFFGDSILVGSVGRKNYNINYFRWYLCLAYVVHSGAMK